MRDPSIHITESKLVKVLEKVMEVEDSPIKVNAKELARLILVEAKGISVNNRSIQVSSDRMEKKVKNMLKSSKSDALLVADIIYNLRKKNKHKGIKRIDQDNRDWPQVKNLAEICLTFCNDFGLSKRKGFIEYLRMGMSKISTPRQMVGKLINMQESISEEYETIQLISEDENPTESKEIHDMYVGMIATNTGITEQYINKPAKYIKFIEVRRLTDEIDIPYDIFLKAQFQGLAWADSFPEPAQLVGDKAMERLNRYLYQNKIKRKEKNGNSKPSTNVLLKLKGK